MNVLLNSRKNANFSLPTRFVSFRGGGVGMVVISAGFPIVTFCEILLVESVFIGLSGGTIASRH